MVRGLIFVIAGVFVRVDDLRGAVLVGDLRGEGLVVLHRDGEGAHTLRGDASVGDVEADHEACRVGEDVFDAVRPELGEERVGDAPADDEDWCEARLGVGAGASLDLEVLVDDVRRHLVRGARSLEPLRHRCRLRDGGESGNVATD